MTEYSMPRGNTSNQNGLTAAQALYIVDRLQRERKVSAREVARMAAEMQGQIAELERRLAMLRLDSAVGTARRRRAGASRRARPVTAAVAASRRLQGEYMGLLRHLGARERVRIKKL